MKRWQWLVATIGLLVAASCSSDRGQRRPYLIAENLSYAAAHMEKGEMTEAAQLFAVVYLADPFNEKAKAGLAQTGGNDLSIMAPSPLGKNRTSRPKRQGIGLRIAMYPINRVLDILDIVSFHVGLEGGIYADAHATRAIQVNAGAGGGMQVGWWQGRNLAVGTGHVAGFGLGPFSTEGEGLTQAGTRGVACKSFSTLGLNQPSDLVYQQHRDYWSVGARAVAGLVGAEINVHPVELADAIAGFFIIDFLLDDIGSTKSLRLKPYETEAMEELLGTIRQADLRARIRGRITPLSDPLVDPTPLAQSAQ